MKGLHEFANVFLHREPIDMRKGLTGLIALIGLKKIGDIKGPHLFVFCGKRRDTLKVIYFDHSGFCMWMKRLEEEKFKWPKKDSDEIINLSAKDFEFLLQGYDISKMKPFNYVHRELIL